MFAFRFALLTLLVSSSFDGLRAQPPGNPQIDGLIQNYELLSRQPAHIQMLTGLMIEDTEIAAVLTDRNRDTVQFIQYVDGRRKPKLKTSEIFRMVVAGKAYQFRFHGPSRGYYLIDQKLAEADAEVRLSNQDATLRELQSEDERNEAVAKQKAFLSDAQKQMLAPHLTQHESEFSVLLTDFPPAAAIEIGGYIDRLCQNMNAMFGLPRTSNVWHGKVVIAVFSSQTLFGTFETTASNNPNFGKSNIVYHNLNERFVVACHRPEMSKALADSVCWGVAGGYVARFRSNAKLPEWVRQGTRGWVSRTMFPDRKADTSDQKTIRSDLSRSGSLLGVLSATELATDRRLMARALITYLITINPSSFGQFFQDLKLGQPWETALATNYGVTPEQFALSFGQQFGVANVQP